MQTSSLSVVSLNDCFFNLDHVYFVTRQNDSGLFKSDESYILICDCICSQISFMIEVLKKQTCFFCIQSDSSFWIICRPYLILTYLQWLYLMQLHLNFFFGNLIVMRYIVQLTSIIDV